MWDPDPGMSVPPNLGGDVVVLRSYYVTVEGVSTTDCIAVTCVIIPTSVNGVTTIVSWLKFDTRTGTFHFDGSTRVLPTMRPVFSANNVKPSSRPLDGNA